MATLGSTYLTLADWAKRMTPSGGIDEVIEVLASSNPILQDAAVMEGNLPTGHRSTQRTTLPSGTWRLLNKGVASTKSTTEQVDDTCGMLEGLSQIDVDLAILNGNEAAFRASEDDAFIAGLSADAATAIFYGNVKVNPEQMHGFAPRYGELGTYVLSGGGAGSTNTSVWIITWGPKTCHLIFPKGSQAGLKSEDLGKQLVPDSDLLADSGATLNRFLAYVTRFQWKLGLTVRDYRYVARVCNVDVALLTADAASGADLLDKMIDAFYVRPSGDLGNMAKTFVYCNKTIAKFLHKQAMNKSNVNLTLDNVEGKMVTNFLGAPVHICDAIVSTEATIS